MKTKNSQTEMTFRETLIDWMTAFQQTKLNLKQVRRLYRAWK